MQVSYCVFLEKTINELFLKEGSDSTLCLKYSEDLPRYWQDITMLLFAKVIRVYFAILWYTKNYKSI